MQQLRSFPATLKACSLVCRDWCSPAQRYLFASVTLRNHVSCNNMNRLLEINQKPSQQGQVLLAYLPTSRLEHVTNKAHPISFHISTAVSQSKGSMSTTCTSEVLLVSLSTVSTSAPWELMVIGCRKIFCFPTLNTWRLVVKGKFPMETLKELLQGLPMLYSFELHPFYDPFHRSTPAVSNTTPPTFALQLQELALSRIESNDALLALLTTAVDSSHLEILIYQCSSGIAYGASPEEVR
ncbi:hypothetical protein D9758_009438 [Tetrapyrgos nigripes]|uniref:Uncharacterized protein n=1 Tax=Tetrapyrgos nigripes TaxID=182062 RepID=A0A8H5FWS3_9AGAR|nr:hypothetical protein D9758_009438 [Tetrapyrgos nigripes]